VGALPTGSIAAGNRQPSESNVVHDHVRLRQHQIGPIAGRVVAVGARHVEDAGTAQASETVGCSSGSGEPARVGARPR
jgi:hypothetical protein